MSRRGDVYLYDKLVGTITESTDGEYIFEYTDKYFKSNNKEGISLNLPLTQKKYQSDKLLGFFDGLIPEGWLLNHAVANWKLQLKDRMGLLLNLCHGTIGATHIIEHEKTIENKNIVSKEWPKSDDITKFETNRCLISYQKLETDFYLPKEAKRIYGNEKFQSQLEIGLSDLEKMAQKQINTRLTVTGVQKKLSININTDEKSKRLTVVNFDGNFILKPPSEEYPNMPEIEHLCMKMAKIAGFDVPECALIPLRTGELAYIVKRFDRKNDKKLYQEDFCQLLDKSTDDKYKSSIEKCSKLIEKFCKEVRPNMSLFFDLNFYNYLIGNADMHLKNFSLVKNQKNGNYQLSPCYDLLSTRLLIPNDKEQTALAINGKKNKLQRNDWIELAKTMGLDKGYVDNTFKKYNRYLPKMKKLIEISFLTEKNKKVLTQLMIENLNM